MQLYIIQQLLFVIARVLHIIAAPFMSFHAAKLACNLILITACNILIAHTTSATLITVEAKQYESEAFLVFHRPDEAGVTASASGSSALISAKDAIALTKQNPDLIASIVKSMDLAPDQMNINITFNARYLPIEVITGEKLNAIKLKDIEHEIYNLALASNEKLAEKIDTESQLITTTHDKANNLSKISFAWQKNTALAAFTWKNKLYLIFNKLKNFQIPNDLSVFQSVRRINHPDHTILALTFHDNAQHVIAVEKNKNIWSIVSHNHSTQTSKSKLTLQEKSDNKIHEVLISGDFAKNKLVQFTDEETGENFIALPLIGNNQFITQTLQGNGVDIVPTAQGIVFVANKDQFQATIDKRGLTIAWPEKNIEGKNANEQNASPTAVKRTNVEMSKAVILPVVADEQPISFTATKRELFAQTLEAANEEELYKARLKLAEFYFSNQMYHESAGALELTQRESEALFDASPYVNFLYAVNMSILAQYKTAEDYFNLAYELYLQVTKMVPEELIIWKDYNDYKRNGYSYTLEPVANKTIFTRVIEQYPDHLYWQLYFAFLDHYLHLNKIKEAASLLEGARAPLLSSDNDDLLNYYVALIYKKLDKFTEAKAILETLSKKATSPYVLTLSGFELTKWLYANKEIDANTAAAALENLRFTWRGDKLEYDLLLQLGEYYKQAGKMLSALRVYKYANDVFEGRYNNFFLTSEMVQIYNQIFASNGEINKMSDFETISAFYEFRFLNPIGIEGDDIILMVAKRMINLDLLDNAASLMKHQIQHRLAGEKKVITAEHLAVVYLMDNKPQEAIAVIEHTDADNSDMEHQLHRSFLKAAANIALKNYDAALQLLKGNNSKEADTLRQEIYFQCGNYQEYIALVEPDIMTNLASNTTVQDEEIVRLAISYSALGRYNALKHLNDLIKEPSKMVSTMLNLLLMSGKSLDLHDIAESLPVEKMQEALHKNADELFKI